MRSKKFFVISLRTSILTLFISLFLSSLCLIISINYYRSLKDIQFLSYDLINLYEVLLSSQISVKLTKIEWLAEISQKLIQNGLLSQYNNKQMANYLQQIQMDTDLIRAIYWVDNQGHMVSLQKPPNNSLLIKEEKINQAFHVWYVKAKSNPKTFWARVYRNSKEYDTALIHPIFDEKNQFLGVFAFGLSTDFISTILNKIQTALNKEGLSMQGALIYVIKNDGKLLAAAKTSATLQRLANLNALPNYPKMKASFEKFKKLNHSVFVFNFNKQDYLVKYRPFPDYLPDRWFVGIIMPQQDLVGRLQQTKNFSIIIAACILILGILLVIIFSSRITRALSKQTQDMDNIRQFHLKEPKDIPSHIKEVIDIATALKSMRQGLRSFRKYVPANLVRHLIRSGKAAKVGGEKKQLVSMFTDIKDFTELTEKIDADLITQQLCEYFSELSHIIMRTKGTIDKYIGDSIMVFWGAPVSVKNSSRQAARAALLCQQRLLDLNATWEKAGKPVFVTRIGIHLGTAVIGNIGSEERMNYTVIGDMVNTASRIEGLNKVYNTNIIITEPVFDKIKNQFALRFIDHVAVKGKNEVTSIYELIADEPSMLSYNLEHYSKTYAKAFKAYKKGEWKTARALFEDCLKIYPDDNLAIIFIKRCTYFLKKPPKDGWVGVWHFDSK